MPIDPDDKDVQASCRRVAILFEDCPGRGKGGQHVWNFYTNQCELCPEKWPYGEGPCDHDMWDWDIFGDHCPACGKKMR